jgi:hypothetical protein
MKTLIILIKVFCLLVIIVLFSPACQKNELGNELYFHIGEKQKIASNLSFTVDSIWDSRCPTGWECLWAGDVAMFFNINHSHVILVQIQYLSILPVTSGKFWKLIHTLIIHTRRNQRIF